MVEVRTTIPAFKRIVKETGNAVFESQGLIATTYQGMFVIAQKRRPNRLFPESFPLRKLGYSGIGGFEWGGSMADDVETDMRELLKSLNADELEMLKKLLKA